MEVRANDGKGPLLFEWHPEHQTIDLIRKDKFYSIQLGEHSYCVMEEHSKYELQLKVHTQN